MFSLSEKIEKVCQEIYDSLKLDVELVKCSDHHNLNVEYRKISLQKIIYCEKQSLIQEQCIATWDCMNRPRNRHRFRASMSSRMLSID